MTDLPSAWANAKFSDFGTWVGGGTPSKANPRFWGGPIPWVSPKDMKTKIIRETIDGITEEAVGNSAAKLVPAGSVLIVTRSGILAHTLPIAITAVESTLNQDLKALTLPDGISADYVAWGMRAFEQRILDKCRKGGTTVHSIEMPRLASFELPIAPTNEQRRIVEKIEALFDEIDAGVQSLQKARATLGHYRQSLLKSAFEGRLTADWRAQNADKLEAPETLLARIQTEGDTRYKAALDDWQTALTKWRADGEQGKKPAKPKRPKEPARIEVDVLPELPKSWLWATLDEIVSGQPRSMQSGPFGSSLKHSEFRDRGILVVGIDNVRNGSFSMGSENRISPEKYSELMKYTARPRDLLITVMASLGRSCVIPESLETAIITKHVYRITIEHNLLDVHFYNYLVQAEWVTRKAMLQNAFGQTRPGINSSVLRSLPVPILSKKEQTEIVRILDARLDAANAMETEIDAALTRAEALRQSILKKAFSGQLVPQDPTDEPALVLLERIKTERAKAPKRPRTRKVRA